MASRKAVVVGSDGRLQQLQAGDTLAGLTASDLLSVLTGSEISVTGATTLTYGRWHVLSDSGTPADYTVNLPAASATPNGFVGISVSESMVKLPTIDAGSGVLINGVRTRKMWAGESAILKSNGTHWRKVAGLTIPMSCELARTSNVTLYAGQNKIPMNSVVSDPTGRMYDTDQIIIVRESKYLILGTASFSTLPSDMLNIQAKIYKNGVGLRNVTANGLNGGVLSLECAHTAILSVSDKISLYTYLSASSVNLYYAPPYENQISVLEMPAW